MKTKHNKKIQKTTPKQMTLFLRKGDNQRKKEKTRNKMSKRFEHLKRLCTKRPQSHSPRLASSTRGTS